MIGSTKSGDGSGVVNHALSLAPITLSGGASVVSASAPALVGAGGFREFVAAHSQFVWRSVVRLGVPRADAEDALQQVFLVASRRLADIQPGKERAFLFATCLRVASRSRRTIRRRREVTDDDALEPVDRAPGPDDALDRDRARALLYRILDELPVDLRAVLVLFELEQVSSPEIAELLGIPVGTVASRLRRAREEFKARVRRWEARGQWSREKS